MEMVILTTGWLKAASSMRYYDVEFGYPCQLGNIDTLLITFSTVNM